MTDRSLFRRNRTPSRRGKSLRVEQLESRHLLAATEIEVLAAGLSGQESMALEINGIEVQRWNSIGGNFDDRDYQTFNYTHPVTVTADDVVVRMVDSAGANKDLRVDGIRVARQKYESESPQTWSTGGWDNDLQSIFPSYGSGEFIFSNYGAFHYSAEAGSELTILAAGATGTETMQVSIGGQVVQTWNNIGGDYDLGDFQSFTYTHPTKLRPEDIQVAFTNDGDTPQGDRNLKVDAIEIDGIRWQTESATTYSTGTWIDGVIEPSFPQSESLHTDGFFAYSSADPTGSQILFYAAGSTGEEELDLIVDGRTVSSYQSIGGDYDLREFVPYWFVHPNQLDISDIELAFTNDQLTPVDRNLRIDAVALDGVRYETEDLSTLSTGTWQPLVGIQPGFWQSESLHADGSFKFGQVNSDTGTLSLGDTQYTVDENGIGYVDLEVIRTGGSLGALTLDYTTLDGTAIAGEDYVANSGTVVFADGQTTQIIRVTIIDDADDEGTHTFNIAADRVTGGAFLGQPRTTTISIFDDESPGLGNGNGLRGEYYSGLNFDSLITVRTDETIDFNWLAGQPHVRVPADNFTVRWTGEILPRFDEVYTFETTVDDGVRLWVNDVLVVDKWIDQSPTAHSGQIELQSGVRYSIRLEYYEKGGGAFVQLRWSSASQAYEIIPESQLFSEPIGPDDGQFSGQTVITGLTQPTAIDFAEVGEDDLMYIAQKDGNVKLAINGVLQPGVFLDYTTPVNNVRDRGLLGLAVHPDFVNNPYVYLLYTYDPPEAQGSGGLGAPDNFGNRGSRLTRVTADVTTGYTSIVPGSEKVLLGTGSTWENISNPFADSTDNMGLPASGLQEDGTFVDDILITDSQSHTIGALAFAPDGSLYVSNGDGTSYGRVDPRTTRVQRLDSLSGKVLRINPLTGDGYSDNPFFTGDITDDQSKVFNLGLRNPFRMAVHPENGLPYVGDVGWVSWEEINGGRGQNFGWPYYEGGNGQNLQTGGYNGLAEAQAFYNSGEVATPPVFSRSHANGGVAIVMGDFYTGDIYPELYQNAAFYTDYGDPNIRALTINADNTLEESLFVMGSVGTVVEMSQGPDGYMYYVNIGGTVGRFEFVETVSAATAPAASLAALQAPEVTQAPAAASAGPTLDSTPQEIALELLMVQDGVVVEEPIEELSTSAAESEEESGDESIELALLVMP